MESYAKRKAKMEKNEAKNRNRNNNGCIYVMPSPFGCVESNNFDVFLEDCRASARSCTSNNHIQNMFEKVINNRKSGFYWGCIQASECLSLMDANFGSTKPNYKEVEEFVTYFENNYREISKVMYSGF